MAAPAMFEARHRDRYSLSQFVLRQLPPIAVFRLALSLQSRKTARDRRRFVVGTLAGPLYADTTSGDLVPEMVAACGFWDWKSLAIASMFCAPGDGIIEIGAHTGTETIGFAGIVGPNGRVTAFEPGAAQYAVLLENVRLNGFRHVEVVNCAVGDSVGSATFIAPDAQNSGSSFIASERDAGGDAVPIATIDALAGGLGRARAMFVDVEGFEVRVLRGARAYIAAHRPVIVLEAYGLALTRAGTSVAELVDELRSQGYEPFAVSRLGLKRVRVEGRLPELSENWLCLPVERRHEHRKVTRSLLLYAFVPCAFGLHPIAVAVRKAAARAAAQRSTA